MTAITLEVCRNTEWLRENAGLNLDLIEDGMENEAADMLGSLIDRNLCDAGFETTSPKGQRASYHGWNGANTFSHKFGAAATFDNVTPGQEEHIEAAMNAAIAEVESRFAREGKNACAE